MTAILLVAARELRQILSTRGFWVMLLIMPVAIGISILASVLLAPQFSSAYTIVDASGVYAPAIERRLELQYQREALRELSAYVDRWHLASVAPRAAWARPDAWLSDAEVSRFAAAGGTGAALRLLQPRRPERAPAFKPTPRAFLPIAAPPGVRTDHGADAFGRSVALPLQGDVATAQGKRPLALAVYIPKEFGAPGVAARMWTNGRFNGVLIETVRDELTAALRLRALEAHGLAGPAAIAIETLRAPVRISEPPTGSGRSMLLVRSIVPLALVYLLIITAVTTGSLMLQGLIEERSNKLLESVLACIRPDQLMQGKLLGLGGVGLSVATIWAGCAIVAAYTATGLAADLLRPSLEALSGPWVVLAMLFYFVSGYLIVAMLFLAIGSVSDSMQDAQSYLTPVILLITIPIMILLQASLRNPDAAYAHILSWIPLYTPFAMLARLGTGVSLVEVLGTGLLLVAFLAIELTLLGRLFRASLLSSGQSGGPRGLARLIFATGER